MSTCAVETVTTDAATLEQRIRSSIETLSYLPTTVAVAMKFIELGKNPEAEPAEYAKVISSDSALSSKLLALANSPWFGVRNKVTSVRLAVNLLGLGTVRTLAISYCMAGLHNGLKLKPDEARMFWEASLCRAVAARECAAMMDPAIADEAFVCGMFQDFALPVMYAVGREPVLAILQDNNLCRQEQLIRERERCRLDHCEIGRILAQKMELPEVFVDAVAFHHHQDRLNDFMENEALAKAIYASSLFPVSLQVWTPRDADELCRFLVENCSVKADESGAFFWKVQQEFNRMYHYFEDSAASETRLADLMVQAAKEQADNTTTLVKTVNELMQDAAKMGIEITQLLQQNQSGDKAERDFQTGLYNRQGFERRATEILARAARYRVGLAIVFFDIDTFKTVNDELGREFGDRALKMIAGRIQSATRQHDLAARFEEDEFALLMNDCREEDVLQIVQRVLEHVAAEPVGRGKRTKSVSLSAGVVYVEPSEKAVSLEGLTTDADILASEAKSAGGNQIRKKVVGAAHAPAK